jgi:hypothetical protein
MPTKRSGKRITGRAKADLCRVEGPLCGAAREPGHFGGLHARNYAGRDRTGPTSSMRWRRSATGRGLELSMRRLILRFAAQHTNYVADEILIACL